MNQLATNSQGHRVTCDPVTGEQDGSQGQSPGHEPGQGSSKPFQRKTDWPGPFRSPAPWPMGGGFHSCAPSNWILVSPLLEFLGFLA